MVAHLDKKSLIEAELLKYARKGKTEFYKEFGKKVGIGPQGPWKPVLDIISRQQTAQGLPDITFILITKSTGYPGQIDFKSSKKPTEEQKKLARKKLQEVFDHYSPGARVPF